MKFDYNSNIAIVDCSNMTCNTKTVAETPKVSGPPNIAKGGCSNVTNNTIDNVIDSDSVIVKETPERSGLPNITKGGCFVVKDAVSLPQARNHGQNTNIIEKKIPKMSGPPNLAKGGCFVAKEAVSLPQNAPKSDNFLFLKSKFSPRSEVNQPQTTNNKPMNKSIKTQISSHQGKNKDYVNKNYSRMSDRNEMNGIGQKGLAGWKNEEFN